MTRRSGALLMLATLGCEDPLHPEQTIEKTRAIGARSEVTGQPERATPAPGESAEVVVWLAAPGGAPETSYALWLCERDAVLGDVPGCSAPPLVEARRDVLDVAAPRLAFVAPSEASRLLLFGVVCGAGVASPLLQTSDWPEAMGCSDGHAGGRVSFELDMAPEVDNLNPQLTADALSLDGAPWSEGSDPCGTGPSVPATGGKSRLALALRDADREVVDGVRETLSVAAFSDAGELGSTRQFVEPTDPTSSPAVTFAWTRPKSAPAGGRVVRFWFVLRDGRGGADLAERALCLVPAGT